MLVPGGWNIFKKNEAVIIAVWETLEKYNLFMSEIHDQIITRNEQTSSYENIEVSLWKTDTDIKYNEILDYKYLVLEHTENHNLIHDETGDNYVCMSHYKNEEESRVLSFRNELGEVIHSGDVFIRIDKEWTVNSSRCQ